MSIEMPTPTNSEQIRFLSVLQVFFSRQDGWKEENLASIEGAISSFKW